LIKDILTEVQIVRASEILHSQVTTDDLKKALTTRNQTTQTDSKGELKCTKLVDLMMHNSDYRRQMLLYLSMIIELAKDKEADIAIDTCEYGDLASNYRRVLLKDFSADDADELYVTFMYALQCIFGSFSGSRAKDIFKCITTLDPGAVRTAIRYTFPEKKKIRRRKQ
jgi:hypothetical protein